MGIRGTARPSLAPGEILHDSEAGVMGQQGNLMFIVASGGASMEALDRSCEIQRAMTKRYPQGYVRLMITAPGAPMPSSEARERFKQIDAEFGGSLLASGTLIMGEGLLATTMLLVLRSLGLALRRRYPTKFFSSLEESLEWLGAQCGSEKHFRAERVLEMLGRLPPAEVHDSRARI